MEQEPQNKNTALEAPVNYDEKIVQQQAVVDRLTAEYDKTPSGSLQADLKRKSDTLLHLKNLAKGEPRERARRAAESARKATLDRAVKQVPQG